MTKKRLIKNESELTDGLINLDRAIADRDSEPFKSLTDNMTGYSRHSGLSRHRYRLDEILERAHPSEKQRILR